MAFSQAFIDEVKNKNDIEETVGKYVALKRAGSNTVGLCPFHNERTPSFTVFPATRSFYCFGCGAGGDVISFIMRAENLEYPEAVEYLAKTAGIPIEENETRRDKPSVSRERIFAVTKAAARFFVSALASPQGAAARDYLLNKRRFTAQTIRRFGIGYAPDSWDSLTSHLTSSGFTPLEIQTAFLGGTGKRGTLYDMFRNRIMFPIFDISGEVVAFSGRRLNENDERKYVNTSDTPIFRKSRVLFGMNIAKNTSDGTLILCEGAPDAIAMHQAGFDNAAATLGTAITAEHARIIARCAKTVYLAYDTDKAGRAATMKGIDLLSQVGVAAKIIDLGKQDKDPDEFIKKHGADAFRARLSGSVGQVDYKIDEILSRYDLSVPDQKLRAAGEMTDFLSTLIPEVRRDVYAGRASEKLDISKKSLLDEADRKAKRSDRKKIKDFQDGEIRRSMGYGDQVNTDRIRFSAAAAAEEKILGIMLSRPDVTANACKTLCEDDFITEFGRKVFLLFKDDFAAGAETSLSKDGALTPQQTGAVAKMIAARSAFPGAGAESLGQLIQALKNEKKKRDYDKKIEEDPAALDEYIRSLKADRKEDKNNGENG